MGFMKPSTPSTPAPVQTIPVKAESVGAEVGEDYQARERQRQGMISTILARRGAAGGQEDVESENPVEKNTGIANYHGRTNCGTDFRV